eukprot:3440010-Amphidinium_carterae.2
MGKIFSSKAQLAIEPVQGDLAQLTTNKDDQPDWLQKLSAETSEQRSKLKTWIDNKLHCVDVCQQEMSNTIVKLETTLDNVCTALSVNKPTEAGRSHDAKDDEQTHVTLILESRMAAIEEEMKALLAKLPSASVKMEGRTELDTQVGGMEQMRQELDRCVRLCNLHSSHISAMATRLQI